MRRRGFAAALAGAVVVLVSCLNPFDPMLSRQAADTLAPVIMLTSPQDGATYQSEVTVAGTVSDGANGRVGSLTLSIPVTETGTALSLDSVGAFSYTFSTAGITRAIVMTLRAKDWNGNTTDLVFTLFNDDAGPGIAILSPEDASSYLSSVQVEGRIQSLGELGALTVSIAALNVQDEALQPGAEGGFSYAFSTVGVSGTIQARFRATDHNGNVSAADLTLYNDGEGPYVEITEPANMSYYSSVVRVSGRVLDSSGATTMGEVESASYSVPGTSVTGTLTLAADGAFSFEFRTKDASGLQVIDGPRTIEVTARDWNLNSTTGLVTILRAAGGGDVASFSVTPGNKRASFSWDPVLHATSYTLHNPRSGQVRQNVTSPYAWEGLTNGELYSFQLQAVIPADAGADGWSDLRDIIPLSERTLAPWVKEVGYRSVTIEWVAAPAVAEYVVERRAGNGEWLTRTITAATSLADTGLEHDTLYAYRVTPIEQGDITSGTVSATPGRFPAEYAAVAGFCDTPGDAQAVAVAGSYAYVAAGEAGLQVIDITDPAAPVRVGWYDPAATVSDVALSGNRAYLASSAGLEIVDITNPAAPVPIGTYTAYAMRVAVSGTRACVASGSWLTVVDVIGTPPAFNLVDTTTTFSSINDLTAVGSAAYVADHSSGLRIVDNLSTPDIYRTCAIPSYYAYGVAASGSYAYVGVFGAGLRIIQLSTPQVVGSCDPPTGYAVRVAVAGPYAYVAAEIGDLQVIRISSPTAPVLVGGCSLDGGGYDVAVAGSTACVANGLGLVVLDVSHPAAATLGDVCSPPSNVGSVIVSGDFAYVADSVAGLQIIDISTETPHVVGGYEPAGFVQSVAVAGDHAYVTETAGPNTTLWVFDISNPAAPALVGSAAETGYIQAIAGDYAFGSFASALHVLDISDPAAPVRVGSFTPAGGVTGIAVVGSRAYLAEGTARLEILDISTPTSPILVTALDTLGAAYAVAVVGSYAFVAAYTAGLRVIDVSVTPPVLKATLATSAFACDVVVAGPYAYVAVLNSGVDVVDISDPLSPVLVGTRDTNGTAYGLAVAGSRAYVADYAAGLQVLDLGGD